MKRILVIDDDEQMRQIMKQMLEREGYEVVDAANGREGLRLYREAPSDLIITDIIMPEKEGLETIFELMRDYQDVKIIAISGGSRLIKKEECLDLCKFKGIPTLSKPFDRQELIEAVHKVLGDVVVS